MNYEYEIQNLKNQIKDLQDSVRKIAQGNTAEVSKREQTTAQVNAITPYTETKTGYYGEREKTFYDVPIGNITVFFSNYNGNYSVGKIADRVTVSFDTLTEQTDITISVK